MKKITKFLALVNRHPVGMTAASMFSFPPIMQHLFRPENFNNNLLFLTVPTVLICSFMAWQSKSSKTKLTNWAIDCKADLKKNKITAYDALAKFMVSYGDYCNKHNGIQSIQDDMFFGNRIGYIAQEIDKIEKTSVDKIMRNMDLKTQEKCDRQHNNKIVKKWLTNNEEGVIKLIYEKSYITYDLEEWEKKSAFKELFLDIKNISENVFKYKLNLHFNAQQLKEALNRELSEKSFDYIARQIYLQAKNNTSHNYAQTMYLLENYLAAHDTISNDDLLKGLKYIKKTKDIYTSREDNDKAATYLLTFIAKNRKNKEQLNSSILNHFIETEITNINQKKYVKSIFNKEENTDNFEYIIEGLKMIGQLVSPDKVMKIIDSLNYIMENKNYCPHIDYIEIKKKFIFIETISYQLSIANSFFTGGKKQLLEGIEVLLNECNEYFNNQRMIIEQNVLKEVKINTKILKRLNAHK